MQRSNFERGIGPNGDRWEREERKPGLERYGHLGQGTPLHVTCSLPAVESGFILNGRASLEDPFVQLVPVAYDQKSRSGICLGLQKPSQKHRVFQLHTERCDFDAPLISRKTQW